MKLNNQLLIAIAVLLTFSSEVLAQESILGKWKTIDDNTGKARSVVEIYKKGDKYFGKVTEMFRGPNEDPNPVCNECEENDPRYLQPVLGMEILSDAVKGGDQYIDGEILDPENGKVYSCKLWIEDGNLMLRGYVTIFFRTQTWIPYN